MDLTGIDHRIERFEGDMKRRAGKKKKRRSGLGLIALFVMVICVVVVYNRIGLESEEKTIAAEYDAAQKMYEDEVEREQDLDELQVYTRTKKFKEDVARDKFGLVYENEILFEAGEGE